MPASGTNCQTTSLVHCTCSAGNKSIINKNRDLCTVSVHNYSGVTALSKGIHSHTAMANAIANNMSSINITIQVWLMCYNLSIEMEMYGNAV